MKKTEITQFNDMSKKHKLLCVKIKKQLELIHKAFCKVNRLSVCIGDFRDTLLDDFQFTKINCIYKTRDRYNEDEPYEQTRPIELMFLNFKELIEYYEEGLKEYKLKRKEELKKYREKNKKVIKRNELKQYKRLHKKYGGKK